MAETKSPKKPYKIKIPKVRITNEEVDVVEALRERAAHHVASHLAKEPRRESDEDGQACYEGDVKPIHLWSAKLCLEIAQLFKQTES